VLSALSRPARRSITASRHTSPIARPSSITRESLVVADDFGCEARDLGAGRTLPPWRAPGVIGRIRLRAVITLARFTWRVKAAT
jgi:hypothetical protein